MTAQKSRHDLLVEEGAALPSTGRAAPEPLDAVVIGGGQAGLSVGYHLERLGERFVILDASERVGDAWRRRWDSLRLFTPAWLDALDGLPFPAPAYSFPTKDEMADYLESYASHFGLPVQSGVRVESLTRSGGLFRLVTNQGELWARRVVVALSSHQERRSPAWARELASDTFQLHSGDYKTPAALRDGPVLIVGAGNSGAEIAMELRQHGHAVFLAGRDTGNVPFRIGSFWGRSILCWLLLRVVFHRLLTIRTPFGRKARPKLVGKGGPLIRQRPGDLERAGVERVGRVVGVTDGRPRLEDGRVLGVSNVVFATGFGAGLGFIELPIFDERGALRHDAGVACDVPGLYFVGQHFLYSFSSTMIHGVGRDARRIAERIHTERSSERQRAHAAARVPAAA